MAELDYQQAELIRWLHRVELTTENLKQEVVNKRVYDAERTTDLARMENLEAKLNALEDAINTAVNRSWWLAAVVAGLALSIAGIFVQ